jgi:TetR/AcrR family transcriptional regulator, repressor of fatR-cypB operon
MEGSPIQLSRRDRERLLRRTEILGAAKEIFAEKGYNKATLSGIAYRAEFGKGTIYNYFPGGKEEILIAIFDQLYEGLKRIITESFQLVYGRSFRETMQGFLVNSFEFFSSHIHLFLILIKEAERLHLSDKSDRATFFNERHNEIIETLAAPLSAAMKRGDLRPLPPTFLAHMIFLNLKGCHLRHCPHSVLDKAPAAIIDAEQIASQLTDFILFGASGPALANQNPGATA